MYLIMSRKRKKIIYRRKSFLSCCNTTKCFIWVGMILNFGIMTHLEEKVMDYEKNISNNVFIQTKKSYFVSNNKNIIANIVTINIKQVSRKFCKQSKYCIFSKMANVLQSLNHLSQCKFYKGLLQVNRP